MQLAIVFLGGKWQKTTTWKWWALENDGNSSRGENSQVPSKSSGVSKNGSKLNEVVIYDLHDADFEELELGNPDVKSWKNHQKERIEKKMTVSPKCGWTNPDYPELFYFFVGGFICWWCFSFCFMGKLPILTDSIEYTNGSEAPSRLTWFQTWCFV